jgi:hypothetical protein
MNTGNHSYAERIQGTNLGEELFESYCKNKGFHLTRIGFDEHKANVPNFFNLNSYIRNIPDYVVNTQDGTFVVNVKGTDCFKQSEYRLLPLFGEWFSSSKAPLIYAFCFKEKERPILIYPEKIIRLYEEAKIDKEWSDGVIWRCLGIRNPKNGEQSAKLENCSNGV